MHVCGCCNVIQYVIVARSLELSVAQNALLSFFNELNGFQEFSWNLKGYMWHIKKINVLQH